MTDWISVKDRMPEKEGRYLVYAPGTNNMGEIIMRIIPHRDNKYIRDESTITHWMPLPAPPKEVHND